MGWVFPYSYSSSNSLLGTPGGTVAGIAISDLEVFTLQAEQQSAVPEPASAWLLGAGAVVVLWRRRRAH
jgi:hypothetical protein